MQIVSNWFNLFRERNIGRLIVDILSISREKMTNLVQSMGKKTKHFLYNNHFFFHFVRRPNAANEKFKIFWIFLFFGLIHKKVLYLFISQIFCTLFCFSRLPWGWQFSLKASMASCCGSKHSSGPTICLNHTTIQKPSV